ncbi:uncharacterized protein LY89DRAFT_402226 [Mollisia scopiformis]|uniref:G-protein coupled receptors family 2 profile 2 domain-containing protein n=1 Tax=Mollisia scopiformis TaxID=149040 RepID=A0A132B4Q2_MOLSC|nr:uncharacterized protein LY89DRAFT_402226 [Mollisia scopiformis]KUJ06647.1 hypothetical protein LY89DRAFT_402226 [Mollisia scopiformis]
MAQTMEFTLEERLTMGASMRAVATLSATATILAIAAFLLFKEFRTLPNTLIILASPANLLSNVAQFIAEDALGNPEGAECQLQAFMLEWFVQSDPYWSCAASITVGLIFFYRFGQEDIKRLYWWYSLLCYGIPFVLGLVCLLVNNHNKSDRYFGNAVIWCWIDPEHAVARIYLFYGPVWVTIIVAIFLYVAVGVRVFTARSRLDGARNSPYHSALVKGASNASSAKYPSLGSQNTDVERGAASINYPRPACSTSPPVSSASAFQARVITANSTETPSTGTKKFSARVKEFAVRTQALFSFSRVRTTLDRLKLDEVKYKYTRTGLLFAISILITWVPPSVNRVYGILHPNSPNTYALNVLAAIVLPSQGLWNAIIFFSTSIPVCKRVWAEIRAGRRAKFVGKMFGWKPVAINNPLGVHGLYNLV